MDLALWDIARRLREDLEAAAWLVDHSVEALATAWRQGEAPRSVRAAVEPFLDLFLVAGGLVMEVGGTMTHGSVVAREYGIPAVVGVHRATERLRTGQRVRVDGSRGAVAILEEGGE